jgi:hypothetical protein
MTAEREEGMLTELLLLTLAAKNDDDELAVIALDDVVWLTLDEEEQEVTVRWEDFGDLN